jgi:hypothetical protein
MIAHDSTMHVLTARIESIGFWSKGLPSWDSAREFVATGALPDNAPTKPSPQLLPPNERRRAPESVAVALDVALAACQAAGRDPALLPSVFASTHGDLSITDYMCATLAADPRAISPTKFHNSVHNAAAGYWTIGAGCMQAASAISAYDASFAEGLIDALAQLAEGEEAVLLVGYDTGSMGPLWSVHDCDGLLGGALVLAREDAPHAHDNGMSVRLRAWLDDGDADAHGPLGRHSGSNAIGPMLPLFDALAARVPKAALKAGPGRVLRVEFAYD